MQSEVLWWVNAVFCAVVGIFLGFAICDVWSGGEGTIKEWQTLITGLIAIFAAYVTVQQMRLSDAAQEKRHADVLAIGYRHDALKVQQALDPNAIQLADWADAMSGRLDDLERRLALRTETSLTFGEVEEFRSQLLLLSQPLADSRLSAAYELFDPPTATAVDKIRKLQNQGWATNGEIHFFVTQNVKSDPFKGTTEAELDRLNQLPASEAMISALEKDAGKARLAVDQARAAAEGVRKLAKRYEMFLI